MGVLFAFAVGYTLGTKAGHRGFEELVCSIKEIRESEEFHAMLAAARSHAGHVLKEVSDLLGNEDGPPLFDDLVHRVNALTHRLPTVPAS